MVVGSTVNGRKRNNMEKNFAQGLVDYFDPWELAEFLQLTVDDLIEAFPDKIDECEDELEEFMEIGTRKR